MNGVVRQNGDTIVPHLTGAQTLLCPADVGHMFIFRDRHLRQLMDRSKSRIFCVCVFVSFKIKPIEEPKEWKMLKNTQKSEMTTGMGKEVTCARWFTYVLQFVSAFLSFLRVNLSTSNI